MKKTAYIKNIIISSHYPYIVYGEARGLVSEHTSLAAAYRAARRDSAGCEAQGGYSDAIVYEYRDDAWLACL